jgi:hypothetical protein
MKLAKITALDDPYYLQLRWILDSQRPMVVEHTILQLKKVGHNYREPRPIPYIFIESVVESRVLDEGAFSELFKTGIAKLKAALTSGPGGDVETLLTFMAPKGGGITTVNNLIKRASAEEGSLLENQQWWEELFGTFNIGDQSTKAEIQQQVQQDLLNPQANVEAGGEAGEAGGEAKPGFFDKFKDAMSGGGSAGDLAASDVGAGDVGAGDDLEGRREALNDRFESLFSRLEKLKADREGSASPVEPPAEPDLEFAEPESGPVQQRLPGMEECNVADLALALLNDHCVQANIGRIGNLMLRRIGSHHHVQMPTISEAGLLGRLRDAVGGIPDKLRRGAETARSMIANPKHAARSLATSGAASNNERAAKLAVQILSEKLRTDFEAKLSANGLTPDQIVTTLNQWQELKPKAEAGNAEAVQQYNAASETLKTAFKLFNHGNAKSEFNQMEVPGAAEDPLDATEPEDATGETETGAETEAEAAPIQATCECGQELDAPARLAGKRIRCPNCKEPLTLPSEWIDEQSGDLVTFDAESDLGGPHAPEQTPDLVDAVAGEGWTDRLDAQIDAALPDKLTPNQARIVWKSITGQERNESTFLKIAERFGGSVPKDKLLRKAREIKAADAAKNNPDMWPPGAAPATAEPATAGI